MSLLFFFFVKQMTAYEMRISDWSSDVCSSDLLRREGVHADLRGIGARHRARRNAVTVGCGKGPLHQRREARQTTIDTHQSPVSPDRQLPPSLAPVAAGRKKEQRYQIGRATCRVRALQYV